MAVFRCEKHPQAQMRTPLGIVVFFDSTVEVDDPELAQALRELPEACGVVEEKAPPKPAARRSRKTSS